MKKTFTKFKSLSIFFRAFLFLALAFLIVGFGTLGSVYSTGGAYELTQKTSNDEKTPCVVFELSQLEEKDENGKDDTVELNLKNVYLNVGAIYVEEGATAKITLSRGTSSSSTVDSAKKTAILENFGKDQGTSEVSGTTANALYTWIAPFAVESSGKIKTYPRYKLVVEGGNILINEVVFVGEKLDADGNGTGETCVIPATIVNNADVSILRHDVTEKGSYEKAYQEACKMLDSQRMPEQVQSSFFRYSNEEIYQLHTINEVRAGGAYMKDDVYTGDRTYNVLGHGLLSLSTEIFGTSPFALRFFPMLASFGVFVVAFFLVKMLTKSEKAGFIFSLIYALCNFAFSLGHLGTPLMLGVFFFLLSLYFVLKFVLYGMEKASLKACAPVALSGIFGALAILINGVYVIPVVGVVALFGLGMLRQFKQRRVALDAVIEEAESNMECSPETKQYEITPEYKEKVVAVANEYKRKNILAPLFFGATLLLGTFMLTLLLLLPVAPAYIKLFDNPASPTSNLFSLAFQAFAGGFTGGNAYASQSAWNFFYNVFSGTGSTYAVTGAIVNPVAAALGLVGIVSAVLMLVKIFRKKDRAQEDNSLAFTLLLLLGGLVLSLVVASFAKGALAFILLAYLFSFALLATVATKAEAVAEGKEKKIIRITSIVTIVLLGAMFALFAVTTFSIPLPAWLCAKIF